MKKNEFETAYEAWNNVWADERGRIDWMVPEPFITSKVSYLKDNGVKEILDLGSGIGRHSLELAKAGFKVSAIDASETGIAYLNEMITKYDLKNIDAFIGSFTNIPYDENSFDAICINLM
ncbi:MAG: class I SAM-dependent methyltransferase [Alphaproteobacteria bacterium]